MAAKKNKAKKMMAKKPAKKMKAPAMAAKKSMKRIKSATAKVARMPAATKEAKKTSMTKPQYLLGHLRMFGMFWLVNGLIFFLTSAILPQALVFGTFVIPGLVALLMSSALLSVIAVAFMPLIQHAADREKIQLQTTHWMVLYYIINVVALWILARPAEILGMGMSSWRVAILLGLVLDIIQGMVVMAMMRMERKT